MRRKPKKKANSELSEPEDLNLLAAWQVEPGDAIITKCTVKLYRMDRLCSNTG